MTSKKKSEEIIEKEPVIVEEQDILSEKEVEKLKPEEVIEVKAPEVKIKSEKAPKYAVGSIVFVAKDAEADLNGFKLFPQYKKYTYTVEAYDEKTKVYSLRRLNLSLSLKEADIVGPSERAHDPLNRRQF
jgi:hypothetical protein